uniref:Uncharacterized protein n=1 Tax=Trichobilharzia regenti TaxID=157069 RepID=A0AA85ITD2_TRIRE|nr:unnamed protein product [Trichobilharzia regenti]
MKFINQECLLLIILLIITITIHKTDGSVVFNLRLYVVQVWLSFCNHFSGTVRYLFKWLPQELGGNPTSMQNG